MRWVLKKIIRWNTLEYAGISCECGRTSTGGNRDHGEKLRSLRLLMLKEFLPVFAPSWFMLRKKTFIRK
jgi:hypothetical protein